MAKDDIKKIIEENIINLNGDNSYLKTIENLKEITSIEKLRLKIERQLDKNYEQFINSNKKNEAIELFISSSFNEKEIPNIANKFLLRSTKLKNFLDSYFIEKFFLENINNKDLFNSLCNSALDEIKKIYFNNKDEEFMFLNKQFKNSLKLFIPFILKNGFSNNYVTLERGIDSSNQGDGAEHIFVAKAMIAGFNASIVDVGSSGYDAVIENRNGDLLKVQVKSYSDNIFSRKGRDRGGEDTDSSGSRSKGKLVTSENCDILVGISKVNGEIILFSKNEIDQLPVQINRNKYMDNWENWNKIDEVT